MEERSEWNQLRVVVWCLGIAVFIYLVHIIQVKNAEAQEVHRGHEQLHADLDQALQGAEIADILVCFDVPRHVVWQSNGTALRVRSLFTGDVSQLETPTSSFARDHCEPVKVTDPRYEKLAAQAVQQLVN